MAEAWYVAQCEGSATQLRSLSGGWISIEAALHDILHYAVQYKTKHRAACVANKHNMKKFSRSWLMPNLSRVLTQEELDVLLVSVALTRMC